MKIQRVTAVCFSPTGGSRGYAEEIGKGVCGRLGIPFEQLDITRPALRRQEYRFGPEDLVIFAAPVYAGRLPQIEGGIFDRLSGDRTPAVYIVSYGNREYEDALLEEMEQCERNGFNGIAAGAWIAPHTFSDKIAANRPDEEDKKQIAAFTGRLAELLQKKQEGAAGREVPAQTLKIPGSHPYKEPKAMPFHPKADKRCTACGLCASVCPVEAINKVQPGETDPARCIDCFACVKNCPLHARGAAGPVLKGLTVMLETKLCRTRKEPAVFFAE